MAKIDPIIKPVVLKLLSRGLVSQSEAARLCGVSRQLVRHWARELDIETARAAYLAKLWQKTARRGS